MKAPSILKRNFIQIFLKSPFISLLSIWILQINWPHLYTHSAVTSLPPAPSIVSLYHLDHLLHMWPNENSFTLAVNTAELHFLRLPVELLWTLQLIVCSVRSACGRGKHLPYHRYQHIRVEHAALPTLNTFQPRCVSQYYFNSAIHRWHAGVPCPGTLLRHNTNLLLGNVLCVNYRQRKHYCIK